MKKKNKIAFRNILAREIIFSILLNLKTIIV